jgi:Leucine-rich repeat (LRR) protein
MNNIGVEQAQQLVKIKKSKPLLKTLCGLTMETELDMSGRGLDPGDAVLLASDFEDNCTLGKLDLSDNEIGAYSKEGDGRAPWISTPEGSRAIAAIVKSAAHLSELNVSNINLQVEGAAILVPALEANGTLSSLNILKNDIGADQARVLIKVKQDKKMATLCGLKGDESELYLSGKMNGAADAMLLGEEIKGIGGLCRLDVSGNHLCEEDGKYNTYGLAALSKSIANLKDLNISNNCLKAEGAVILAPAIQDSRVLTSLDISGNNLTNDGSNMSGALALAEAFKNALPYRVKVHTHQKCAR